MAQRHGMRYFFQGHFGVREVRRWFIAWEKGGNGKVKDFLFGVL